MSEEYETILTKGQRFYVKNNKEMFPYQITHGELKLDYIRNTQLKSKRLLVKPLSWSLMYIQNKKETTFGYYKPVDCHFNNHEKLIIPDGEFEIGVIDEKSVYIKVL